MSNRTPKAVRNRNLLKALHDEMIEKELIKSNASSKQPESATSSSLYSNNSSSEDEYSETLERGKKQRLQKRGKGNFVGGYDTSSQSGESYATSDFTDGENEPESPDVDVSSWVNDQIEQVAKLQENTQIKPIEVEGGFVSQQRDVAEGFHQMESNRQKSRNNFEGLSLNPISSMAVPLLGGSKSAFTKVTKVPLKVLTQSNSQKSQVFPSSEKASCKTIGENLFNDQLAPEGKMITSKLKSSEFQAKLQDRQAGIERRHVELCRQREIIKRAEDRLRILEARMDEEEACQREREKKVKSREKRIRKEEDGYRIREESIMKRELKVYDHLKDIDRRRDLLDEREVMIFEEEDFRLEKEAVQREEKYRQNKNSGKKEAAAILSDKPFSNETEFSYASLGQKNDSEMRRSRVRQHQQKDSKHSKHNLPIPVPRKSLEKKEPSSKEKMKRSNSLDSESIFSEENITSCSSKGNDAPRQQKYYVGSLPRPKKKNPLKGLWL